MNALARNRLFAYGSLLALQAKAAWGLWRFRDLTAGDTASYFASASWWAETLRTNPVWSPLYGVFYGSLLWLFPDPFVTVTVQRILVVAALDVLVLAVFRRLVPKGLAWLLAAWFALLPINFDSLYEIHLFSALLPLLAVAVASRVPGHRGRAAALGILLAATLLVRNELSIAAFLWALFCLARERRARPPAPRAEVVRAYGAALLLAAAAWGAALAHPVYPLRRMPELARVKHTLNVCQIYAFGYSQRHPEWKGDPWNGCQALMLREFGARQPGMGEALRANPRAMLEHFAWNVRLVPAGLQLQLFGAISGPVTPDYLVPRRSRAPALLGALSVALLLAGGVLLWRERSRWWDEWLRERAEAWALLGCLLGSSVVVMLMQRPRPSYLFTQCVALLAAIGMAAFVVTRRVWPRLDATRLLPLLALLLVVAVPPHYGASKPQAFGQVGQPLREAVERLRPFRSGLRGREQRLLVYRFPTDTCAYVDGRAPCTGLSPLDLGSADAAAAPTLAAAEARDVGWIYVEETAHDFDAWRSLVREAAASDAWRRVAAGADPARPWALFRRR